MAHDADSDWSPWLFGPDAFLAPAGSGVHRGGRSRRAKVEIEAGGWPVLFKSKTSHRPTPAKVTTTQQWQAGSEPDLRDVLQAPQVSVCHRTCEASLQ